MKRRFVRLLYLLAVVVASTFFSSCKDDPTFDGSLLVGKWVSGSEFYRYDSDYTGVTWDTADDVHEDEAQKFTWEFDEKTSALTHVHQMEMGAVVPKSYTVTALDANTLKYKDKYDQVFSYSRVK